MGHTSTLTSKRCILYIYSTNIGTEYFKHALFSPFFSLQNAFFFHNANLFGSCIIHILYTGCAKIKKKNNSGAKGLNRTKSRVFIRLIRRCEVTRGAGCYTCSEINFSFLTWHPRCPPRLFMLVFVFCLTMGLKYGLLHQPESKLYDPAVIFGVWVPWNWKLTWQHSRQFGYLSALKYKCVQRGTITGNTASAFHF
jgi:hypothetical protein